MAKLATNPQTRNLLSQPDFMHMLSEVQRDQSKMTQYLQDPRFQAALSVGLGINMMSGDQFKDQQQNGTGQEEAASRDADMKAATPSGAEADDDEGPPELTEDPDEVQADPEQAEKEARRKQAQQEKEAGNAAYKAKKFEEALAHYDKALELQDDDISFLTNRAAVHLEQGNYDKAVADCDKAVERGRELRADYKVIARALTRKGNALVKQGRLEDAISVYQKALTEHRNPDTLKRLNETEKQLKQKKEQEYINMDLSNQEKEKGNQAFKEQRYPEAVKHYTEALARGPPAVNPEAYKLYSNRAACYTKLGAWNDGIKDADKCIEMEPTFAKGYSRKGHLQFFMKDYEKAMETYEQGLKQDPNNEELKEGKMRCVQQLSKLMRGEASEQELAERRAKAMEDPEIQNILTDPVMRNVLNDFQEHPQAAQKHLQNPDIANKLQKLIKAGIVRMG
jgi:stress-induced-phosphoprotein 1